jgi:hypothetical protein
MAIFIDSAEAGNRIEFFARDIRIVDLPLEFDLLIATAPTAPADIFPQTDA